MSIAGDLLTAATPARLLCRRGTWVLELVRLVPVDKNVFQPRVQRLEGSEAVLQHLKRNGDSPALASSASQIMRALRPDEDRAFDAVDGDWVPSDPGARRDSTRPSAPPPGPGVAGEVAELRAELLILRAAHERLRERIVRLESQALTGSSTQRALISLPPTPAVTLPNVSDARPAAPLAATLAQGQAPPLAAAPPFPEAPPARAAQPGLRTGQYGLKLPPASALAARLHSATNDTVSAQERLPVTFSLAEPRSCWLSRLINDEGAEVGAIISDLAATIALGGALLALPPAELQAQTAAGEPSEDVLSAMSEVSNILSDTISQQPGTRAVRVKPLEPLGPSSLDWARTSGAQLELEIEGGQGRLLLLAR